MSEQDFAGAGGTGGEYTGRSPELGNHRVGYVSMREHRSEKGSGNGIIVRVMQAGEERGFRIQLGGKFPQYGIRDVKAVIAAIENTTGSDPRIVAMDYAAMKPYFSDVDRKGWGVGEIEIEVYEADKVNAKTGRPYVNARVFKVGSLGNLGVVLPSRVGAPAPAQATAPAAPVAAAPPPAPSPPPAAQAPAQPPPPPAPVAAPEPWYPLASGDPRGREYRVDGAGAYLFR